MTPRAEPAALDTWTGGAPRVWTGAERRWLAVSVFALLAPATATGAFIASAGLAPVEATAAPSLPVLALWGLFIAAPAVLWIGLHAARIRRDNARLTERLRDAEAFAQELDSVAALVRDVGGGIRRWSAGCERLFGFTGRDAVGRSAQQLLVTRFPEGGRRRAQEILLRDGAWNGKLRHRRRDGSVIIVMAHWILQRDTATGAPTGVLEVYADATSLEAAEAALRAGEARLRLAQEVAAIGTWEWDPEEDQFVLSAEHAGLFGTLAVPDAPLTLDRFLSLVHREDREAVRAAFANALECGEYEVEFRVPRHPLESEAEEEVRWMIGRGRRMPGPVGRLGAILGVHVDITARKEAEQRQALLMREVDHRAKNALAVVQAVLRLTRADSPDAFARAVEDRITALARTHTLLAETRWTGVDLRSLLGSEFAPFAGAPASAQAGAPGGVAQGGERVRLDGPQLFLPAVMVQPLSIALHELATNAAKYGALSSPEGRVAIAWEVLRAERLLRLRWSEEAGPTVAGEPQRRGFGSRVIEQTLRRQLGGSARFTWRPEGLLFEAEVPLLPAGAPLGRAPQVPGAGSAPVPAAPANGDPPGGRPIRGAA